MNAVTSCQLPFYSQLIRCVAKVTSEHKNNWNDFLDPILFSIRTSRQESTKHTPFFLMHGREARFPLEVEKSEVNELGNVHETLSCLQKLRAKVFPEVSKNIDASQSRQKAQYKRRRGVDQSMQVKEGDVVLRLNMQKCTRKGSKDEDTWIGPYKVVHISKYGFCHLQSVATGKDIKSMVNIQHLKPYWDAQPSARILTTAEPLVSGDTLNFNGHYRVQLISFLLLYNRSEFTVIRLQFLHSFAYIIYCTRYIYIYILYILL